MGDSHTAKLPQQYGFEKAAVSPRFITCTRLPGVPVCLLPCVTETILNMEATEIVVMYPVLVARYVAQLAV